MREKKSKITKEIANYLYIYKEKKCFISETSKALQMRAFLLLMNLKNRKSKKNIVILTIKLYVYIYCHLHCCENFLLSNQI